MSISATADGVRSNATKSDSKNGKLLDWSQDDASSLGLRNLAAKHHLHKHELFENENFEEFVNAYPRDRLQAFTMGTDPLDRSDWQSVDTTGISGSQLLEAVRKGRLWLNIVQVHTVDSGIRDLVHSVFEEISAMNPGFKPFKITCTLIVSSPNAMVYYHADAQPNLLWQIAGTKRVWIYPADDKRLVPQEFMEDIFASFADEEVPYDQSFDEKAVVLDVNPGEVIAWPQNAPHRVSNLDCVNISLSTPYETEESDRRKLIYCANRLFRRQYHLPVRSTKETGLSASAKTFAYRALRKAGFVETPPRRAYITSLQVDPSAAMGYREIEQAPILTEFSRKDFELVKTNTGRVKAVPRNES